ncbi:hypothetical protein [Bacteroides heparinolyticus]|uniref:hypothetical protein n=1 Tax=Prevotella heparinolytica TaxID=28113 RepID=UPI0035A04741
MQQQLETAKAEVVKAFEQEAELAEKVSNAGWDKGIRQYTDAPAERTSRKAKLEAMRVKVAGR